MNKKTNLILAAIVLSSSTSAMACKFKPLESLWMPLNEAPIVFEGTVEQGSVGKSGTVSIRVDRVFKGDPGPVHSFRQQSSSCDRWFETGSKWLFAGEMLPNPSLPLSGKSSAQAVTREPPKGIPENFLSCGAPGSCRVVSHGCDGSTAVGTGSVPMAKKWLFENAGGNPATLNCAARADSVLWTGGSCVKGRCQTVDIVKRDPAER